MESKISEAIGLKYQSVALIRTDRKPDNAMQFKPGKWGLYDMARGKCGKRKLFGL